MGVFDKSLETIMDELAESNINAQGGNGKRIGSELYVGTEGIGDSVINLKQMEIVNDAEGVINDSLSDFDIVVINSKTRTVRFLRMSSLDEAHPTVKESIVVRDGVSKIGRVAGQIYHRMETILTPTHPKYNFYCEVTAYESSVGALGPFTLSSSTPSGWLRVWEQQVNADADVSWEELQAELTHIENTYK